MLATLPAAHSGMPSREANNDKLFNIKAPIAQALDLIFSGCEFEPRFGIIMSWLKSKERLKKKKKIHAGIWVLDYYSQMVNFTQARANECRKC